MSFALDVAAFVARAKGKEALAVRKIVFDLGERLVMRSPVGDASYWLSPPPPGYVGGRFRANWQYGFGVIPQGVTDATDAAGSATAGKIKTDAAQAPAAGIHYLTNNLPYARRLEEGYSRQAPQGVVALTVVEFESIVKGAAQ